MQRSSACLLALGLAAPAAAAPVNPADYFPLSDGASWTYAVGGGGSNTVVIQPGTVNVGGVATRERRHTAGDEVGSKDFFTSTSGVRLHRSFDALESDTIDFLPPLVLATNPVDTGTSFTTSGDVSITAPGSPTLTGTYSLSWQITGRGPMTTPAGFFCDVIRRHQELTLTVDGDASTSTSDEYFVRGLGMVAETGFDGEAFSGTLTSTTLPLPPADADCDGISDAADRCPFYASASNADTDLDGRGDVCECGDQNGDGRNTVSDLVAINVAIFNPAQVTPLCDATNDGLCNVADIVAVNVEIYSAGSTSVCSRQPVPGP